MSRHLQRQISSLKKKILLVSGLVEDAIGKAVQVLMMRDAALAVEVINADDEIDRTEVDVEEEVLKTLALHQPVAADLRFVVAVLKINNELERMGDIARNIAKLARFFSKCDAFRVPAECGDMALLAQSMVKQSIDALVRGDPDLARQVRETDDEVDAMRKKIQDLAEDEIERHPEQTECFVKLISASRHIERLADMATHVAEDVIYMVEGEIVRHHHPA